MCCGSPPFHHEGERAWARQEYTTIDGRLSSDGISAFGPDISFPVPTPYALHTRIPSIVSSIFESLLTPSILQVTIGGLVIDSQRVTLSDATPPEERTASTICASFTISLPEFKWMCMCDFIKAALRSLAPFPHWGSEKSNRLIATPNYFPTTFAQTMVEPLW